MASNTFDCGTNYLQPSGFKVIINRRDFPNLQFYAQQVSHPDVNLPANEQGFRQVASIPFAGDAMEFGVLQMDVLLDEDMNSYRELYNWMTNTVQTNHELPTAALGTSRKEFSTGTYYDITVAILSSHNNVNRTFTYVNGMPTSIGQISMNATTTEQFLSFPVTFRFDYFNFK